MTAPRIGIVIPAWNAEPYIADAIGSLLAEGDAVDLDIVVVSDGSTDGTDGVVADIAARDPRVRLIIEPHRGVAATRNTGVAALDTPLISFLDADDISVPGRLARQAAVLAANPRLAGVLGDLVLVRRIDRFAPAPGAPTLQLTAISLAPGLFHRAVVEGLRFDESFVHAEDFDFYLRAWERGVPIHYEGLPAVLYRRHGTNMTLDRKESVHHLLRALQRSLIRRRGSGQQVDLPPIFTNQRKLLEMDTILA